jgi:hypothetical protein
VLQGRVPSSLVQHPLQRRPTTLDKVAVEAADGLLLRRRRDDEPGIVSMQRVVEPQEVSVPALDLEFRLPVGLRRGLSSKIPS